MTNFADRRNAERRPVILQASYRTHSGQEGRGRTLDLSSTGVRLETDRRLPVGSPVLLRLQSHALPAYVRWNQDSGNESQLYQVGLALSPGCPDPLGLVGN